MTYKNLFRIFYVLFMILSLISCQPKPPDFMPDVGVRIDDPEWNKWVRLTAFPGGPDKLYPHIVLYIENLSDQRWKFDAIKDIQIFQFQNNQWQKVLDKTNYQNNQAQKELNSTIILGETEFLLESKGKIPDDKTSIPIFPDIQTPQNAYLRIIIIFHAVDEQDSLNNISGAYADIIFSP